MRICFICDGYPPAEKVGGIEVFTQTLARGLVKRGHSVSVVGYTRGIDAETEEDDQGVYVLRLPPVSRGIVPPAVLRRLTLEAVLRRIVRQREIELIECPDVRGSLMLGHFRVPLVVRLHGALNLVHRPSTGRKPDRASLFFERRTLQLADYLVAVSQYIRDATLEAAGLHERKCEVIYNGIDTELFYHDPNDDRDANRILFVGRLSETKGAPNLFQALPRIFSSHPHSYLRFVGKDPLNDSGRKSSTELLSQLPEEFRSRVDFVGELPHEQLPSEYRAAAVSVFPSLAEAHPLSILEAMACGTPVVFMNRGPGPEMIDHGQDGILCDTRSPEAIADAISELLLDPQRALQMGVNAAQRIAATLSLEAVMNRNEAFYLHCLERGKSGNSQQSAE